MSCLSSVGIGGRPGRDFHLQRSLKTRSVPANQGLRAYDDQCGAPCEQPGQQRQAYPRRGIDPPRLHAPLHVQGELPAQEQHLCMQRLARLKRQGNPSDQFAGESRDNRNSAQHPPIMPHSRNRTPSGPQDP